MYQQFSYRGNEVFYTTEGQGQPVVLLHGFAEDGTVWNYQSAFLQQHCRLIVPDLPGSGRSGMLPDTPQPVSIEDYADCIRALLLHEKVQSCMLFGHSMGGYITLAFAEKYPSMPTAYGLIHSTAFADSAEKKKSREKGIEMMGQYGGYTFLKNTTPNLFSAAFKEQHPDQVNALSESGKQFKVQALQQYYQAMKNRPDRTAVLSSNRHPVLFVTGTEDVAAPVSDILQQASLPDISYIHVLQTGHMGMWEAPDKVNGFMLSFINQ